MPERIQLRRTKGWRMPPNTVKVSRPTKWGNHHRIGAPDPLDGEPMGPSEAVYHFRRYIERVDRQLFLDCQDELRGKNLACWCPLDQPCHADVLLEIANQ